MSLLPPGSSELQPEGMLMCAPAGLGHHLCGAPPVAARAWQHGILHLQQRNLRNHVLGLPRCGAAGGWARAWGSVSLPVWRPVRVVLCGATALRTVCPDSPESSALL